MKILVTGAAGYIGSVLVGELLDAGHQVTALDDLSSSSDSLARYTSREGFSFQKGDVCHESDLAGALRQADAIIHLAAIVGMPACDREPERARAVNLEAVRLLLRLRSKSQRIAFPNTNSGYGSVGGEIVCTEETPMHPISLYGRLKCQAEAEVLAEENTVSLRLATVFGVSPRMRRDLLVNFFVWSALKTGRIPVFRSWANATRNFVHVRDVASAFSRIGVFDFYGAFNFGNDEANLSLHDLALLVQRETGDGASIDLTAGDDPDRRDYVVSSAKLARAGITARIGLVEGIRELVRAYWTCPDLYL